MSDKVEPITCENVNRSVHSVSSKQWRHTANEIENAILHQQTGYTESH